MRQPIVFWGTYPSNWAGYVYKEALSNGGRHTGVDYNRGVNDKGDPVDAIASGEVVAILRDGNSQNFGNSIIIKTEGTPPGVEGKHLYHRYLHLDKIRVALKQKVSIGQRIGDLGGTGGFAPHLHLDTWTDRNGLGAHWEYHKWTALSSYEDPYKLIKANPDWDGGEDMLTTKAAGVIVRAYIGEVISAAEREKYVGKISTDDFIDKVKSWKRFDKAVEDSRAGKLVIKNHAMLSIRGGYVDPKDAVIKGKDDTIENQQATIKEREDTIRDLTANVVKLTKERDEATEQVVALQSELLNLKTQNTELQEELASTQAVVAELNESIELAEKEIERLNSELANCGTDCDNLTGWELIALGLKKLLGRSK